MPKSSKTPKLTPKQSRFVDEYCTNGFNATKAVLAAGYVANTANVARAMASQNLSKTAIIKAIDKKKAELERINEIDSKFIKNRLYDIANRAKSKGDLAVEERVTCDLGRHIGFFEADNAQQRDNQLLIVGRDEQIQQLKERIRLLESYKEADDAVYRGE